MEFNHFDHNGNAVMVDVAHKEPTCRTAVAEATVKMKPELLEKVLVGRMSKGDVLSVARLAGIQGAKETSRLIPLSHPLSLHHVAVDFTTEADKGEITASCTVKAVEKTGVEMEAMTGAALAALTIYDMCKGSDKSIKIAEVKLMLKDGGKSGSYRREE